MLISHVSMRLVEAGQDGKEAFVKTDHASINHSATELAGIFWSTSGKTVRRMFCASLTQCRQLCRLRRGSGRLRPMDKLHSIPKDSQESKHILPLVPCTRIITESALAFLELAIILVAAIGRSTAGWWRDVMLRLKGGLVFLYVFCSVCQLKLCR